MNNKYSSAQWLLFGIACGMYSHFARLARIRNQVRAAGRRRGRFYGRGVAVGQLIRVCPGGRHAWFDSPFGPLRKPIQAQP
jgi:hypothetical protein